MESNELRKPIRNFISSLILSLVLCLLCIVVLTLTIREKTGEITKQNEVAFSCVKQTQAELKLLNEQSTIIKEKEQKITFLQTEIEQLNQQLKGLGVSNKK